MVLFTEPCRYHIVQEFNKGVYDYIIATDESAGRGEMDSDDEKVEGANEAIQNSKFHQI